MNRDVLLNEELVVPSPVPVEWYKVVKTDWLGATLRRLLLDNFGNWYLQYNGEVEGELHRVSYW